MTDFWTPKDTMMVIIEIIIGIIISLLTAFVYENETNKRKAKILFKKYAFLQSAEHIFDWQHWNINKGKIEAQPIDSHMTLKYDKEKSFSFQWKQAAGEIAGEGFIFWDNLTHGKMSFYEYEKEWFDYRNVFYKRVLHQNTLYDAIFVNADDQGTKYVMMRVV
jgi:hypothetical protein